MKFSPRSKFFLLSLGVLLLLSISVLSWFLFVPFSKTASTKVIFIKKGTHLRKVSEVLEQEGIIKNRHFFVFLTTILGKKSSNASSRCIVSAREGAGETSSGDHS
jgi:cell division protein YceG involved in septum cleavage